MTTSMPSGDGTVTDGPTQSAVDEEAAPTTGLEPDTAPDAAGETDTSGTADAAPESDPDTRGGTASGSAAEADDQPETDGGGAAPSDRTVLDGPALENEEMHRATDDLRSSEAKVADARGFADELAKSQPVDD